MKPRAAISWSGGKDSYLALHRTRAQFDFCALVTMFNEDGSRSRSHGLRPEMIGRHAQLLGLEPFFNCCSWETYEEEFVRGLGRTREHGVTDVVFGDIFGDAHREWTARVCARAGLRANEPLWGESTPSLFGEFLRTGAEARIVTVNSKWLDASWLGRALSSEMLPQFQPLGVDPCGENGEYHTLVVKAPAFSLRLQVKDAGLVFRNGCWALDLVLNDEKPAPAQQNAT